jgi:hypothetical protein
MQKLVATTIKMAKIAAIHCRLPKLAWLVIGLAFALLMLLASEFVV